MKMALYGEKMEFLSEAAARMKHCFGKTDDTIGIDCFYEKNSIRQQMFSYDIIILSESLLEEMLLYEKRQRQQIITLAAGKQIETFNRDEILYVEAELKKVHIWTKEEEVVMKLPISEVEKVLDKESFIKSHRSYIVNKNQIKSLLEKEIVLKNGKRVPVSKYRWKEVREWYLEGGEE